MSEGAALGLTPAAAFDFLLGEWRLEREIRGHAAIEGLLTVSARADGAAEYREKVALTTREGAVFSGSQRYLVTRAKDGFVLSFAETGAVFQEIYLAATAEGGLARRGDPSMRGGCLSIRVCAGTGATIHDPARGDGATKAVCVRYRVFRGG